MRLLSVVSCYRASPAVFEIYWALSNGVTIEFDLSGLRDVVGRVTNRLAVGHFLLVVRNIILYDAMLDMALNDL